MLLEWQIALRKISFINQDDKNEIIRFFLKISEDKFKEIYINHVKLFRYRRYEADKEVSKNTRTLENKKQEHKIMSDIASKASTYTCSTSR